MIIGAAAAGVCYVILQLKDKLLKNVDDTLDVFICHGLGGVVGSLLTGVLASENGGTASMHQFMEQLIAVDATIVWSCLGTAVILIILKAIMPIRASEERLNLS